MKFLKTNILENKGMGRVAQNLCSFLTKRMLSYLNSRFFTVLRNYLVEILQEKWFLSIKAPQMLFTVFNIFLSISRKTASQIISCRAKGSKKHNFLKKLTQIGWCVPLKKYCSFPHKWCLRFDIFLLWNCLSFCKNRKY